MRKILQIVVGVLVALLGLGLFLLTRDYESPVPSIVGARYDATEVSFGLTGPQATIEPFTLESELMRIAGNAHADLRGPLDGRAAIGLPHAEVGDDPNDAQRTRSPSAGVSG